MNIGQRIKKLRLKKVLTQKELGNLVNVSSQVISNWERGYTPGIDHDDLLKLANALGTSTNYLLGHAENDVLLEALPKYSANNNSNIEYIYQAKDLADAYYRIAQLDIEFNLDDETLLRLMKKARDKYGPPNKIT